MTQPLPSEILVAVDIIPGVEEGKEYNATIKVNKDGTYTVEQLEEIPVGPDEPVGELVVLRHKGTGNAYLGKRSAFSTGWQIAYDVEPTWEDVLKKYPIEEWVYIPVVEEVVV